MEPQSALIQRLQRAIQAIVTDVEALNRLTPEQWAFTPDKNTWSIATTLNHINKTNETVIPRYRQAVANLTSRDVRGTPDIRYNAKERFFIRIVSPNPPFHVPVPPKFLPNLTNVNGQEEVSIFLQQHKEIEELLTACTGYDLMQERITSPASSLVKIRLGAEFDAMLNHDLYHYLQIAERQKHPSYPK